MHQGKAQEICAGRGHQGPQLTYDIFSTQTDEQARNQLRCGNKTLKEADDEVTEVEYPRVPRRKSEVQNHDISVNVEIEIKNQMDHISRDKTCQVYKSLLTKQD